MNQTIYELLSVNDNQCKNKKKCGSNNADIIII